MLVKHQLAIVLASQTNREVAAVDCHRDEGHREEHVEQPLAEAIDTHVEEVAEADDSCEEQ